MKLALVQQHATRDKADNVRRGLEAVDRAAAAGAQLVCFAELSFEWFYPQRPAESTFRSHSETLEGPIVTAFQKKAAEHGVVIVLNFFERDGLETYDCSPVIDANGVVLGMTRMVHITDYACFHEQGYYTPGDTGAPVYQTRVGKIGVAICYDRHFEGVVAALAAAGAELVFSPAVTFGAKSRRMWDQEFLVDACRHRLFIGGSNRRGSEKPWNQEYFGASYFAGPDGEKVSNRSPRPDLVIADLDLGSLKKPDPSGWDLKRDVRPKIY